MLVLISITTPPMHRAARTLIGLVLAGGLALACSGCLVRPYQREHLAAPNMRQGEEPGSAAMAHVLGSREGASSGDQAEGGGCGCN